MRTRYRRISREREREQMASLGKVLSDLRTERDRVVKQLNKLEEAIAAIGSLQGGRAGTTGRARRRLSAAARRRIAQAQKARWAKWKAKRHRNAA
jgi:hypothetical protein